MNYVYVLRSQRNNKRYVGYTARDIEKRLCEHNSVGSGQWTRRNGPFVLVYVQECGSREEARELEKFLKSGQGRQCLDELGV
jgi:putative endonuclease